MGKDMTQQAAGDAGGKFFSAVEWWVGGVSGARVRLAVGVKTTFLKSLFQSVQIGILVDRIEDTWGLKQIVYKQL